MDETHSKPMENKISIRTKISGSFIGLLLVMLLLIVFSYIEAIRVDTRLSILANSVIPLTNHIARLHVYALEQTIIFERITRLREKSVINDQEVEKLMKEFIDYGVKVDKEIHTAHTIVNEQLTKKITRRELVQLAKVTQILKIVSSEHKDFDAHLKVLLSHDRDTQLKIRDLQNQQLEEQTDKLDKSVFEAFLILEKLTESETKIVLFGETSLHDATLIMALITFLVGALISPILTLKITRPLKALSESAQKVRQGDLTVTVPIQSSDEVGELSQSFNAMVEELKYKERIKQMFGKYVDPRIVDSLLEKGGELEVSDNKKQVMTVFFSDIQGFTSISESLTPNGLVKLMNRYFTQVSQPIFQFNGVIDKFIGDAVMAFWGPPFNVDENHASHACNAALAYIESLTSLNALMPEILGFKKNLPQIKVRIGLCTGDVVAGNIGSNECMSFTVLGDTVNVAARLESANKQYGTRIIMDQTTHAEVKDEFETRRVDHIKVVGFDEPIEIFELLARKSELDGSTIELRNRYEQALLSYQSQDWTHALMLIDSCLEINADDGPSKVLKKRIETFQKIAPAADWQGVWQLDSK